MVVGQSSTALLAEEQSMKVKIRKKGPVSMLYIVGKLTIPREVRMREVLNDLLDAGERLFILNMTLCPYLDSAGLGETVASWQRVKDVGGRVVLVMTGKTHSLFILTGLNRVFEIYEDEEEALASFISTPDQEPWSRATLGSKDACAGARERNRTGT
jgi:anti-anti-sigma factor